MTRRYGWKKDREQGHRFLAMPPPGQTFPAAFSLRPGMPGVYDQGQTMGCTGNGTAAVVHFDRRQEGKEDWVPSRKFPYYNGRMREGWQGEDQGAMICDVVDSLSDAGYCAETTCPYDDMTTAPTEAAYREGLTNLVPGRVKLVQDEVALKAALVAGRPILCGMVVYTAFESYLVRRTGLLRVPVAGEKVLGGHCIVLCGWKGDLWELRNSWGSDWGDGGYFWADKEYFLREDLSSDFTIIPKA